MPSTATAELNPLSERYLAQVPRLAFALFSLLVIAVMTAAWLVRDSRYLQAESGLGYLMGIAGVAMMLLLLLYPLRKRVRLMSKWFTLGTWFRIHMLLGVLGPCCILLHSNFRLGSTNSTVALWAMLLVAGSGLVGRYLYGKIHYGLYGEQVRLKQLSADFEGLCRGTGGDTSLEAGGEDLSELYRGCREILSRQQQKLSLRVLMRQRRWLRRQKRSLERVIAAQPAAVSEHFRALSSLLERLAGLRLFERFFALWHVIHIPVFLLMVSTATVHIFVVHWY